MHAANVVLGHFLGLDMPSSADGGVQQYKSQSKYSDKPRLARFRSFATEFFDKRGLEGALSAPWLGLLF